MAHGYLEHGYGTHGEIDPDRGDHRDFRNRQGRDENWSSHSDRNMFSGRELGWSDDDNRSGPGWREGRSERWPEDRWPEQRGRADTYNRQSEDWSGQHRFSSSPDDHYRSWRDRHMGELDRDYQDYCREREEQFHRDFDQWRRRKYGNPQPLRTGMTQTGLSHDPTGMTQAAEDNAPATPTEPDPTGTATLGTNSGAGVRSKR